MKTAFASIPALALIAMGFASTPALALNSQTMKAWCQHHATCHGHYSGYDGWYEAFFDGHYISCPPQGDCIVVFRQAQAGDTAPFNGMNGFGGSQGGGELGDTPGGGFNHMPPHITGLTKSTGGHGGGIIQ